MSTRTISQAGATNDLTGAQKVAAILLSISKDLAARLLSKFDKAELHRLAESVVDLDQLDPENLKLIASEFESRVRVGPGLSVTENNVSDLLMSGLAEGRAEEIIADIYQRPNPTIWNRLIGIDPTAVAQFLAKEHPQTAAFIISELPAENSTKIVDLLSAELRQSVLERLLKIGAVTPIMRREIGAVLERDLLEGSAQAHSEANVRLVADLCGRIDSDAARAFVGRIADVDPAAAMAIKRGMFAYEELAELAQQSLVAVVEATPIDVLLRSMAGQPREFQDLLLGAMPARGRRMAEQELRSSSNLQKREIDEARASVCGIVVRLIKQGLIERASVDGQPPD